MRILTRYILRLHVGPFLFALSALTGILLINAVARQLESLAGKGLPASVFADIIVYSMPYILAQTIPMAVLVAVLHTFSDLSLGNEIGALKASGVNLQRLMLPVLVVSVVLSAAMVAFYDRVLPAANHRLRNVSLDVLRKAPTLKLQEQTLNPIASTDGVRHYYLQAATVDPATNRMRDVVIYDLSEPGVARTIYADSGRMAFGRGQTDLFLDLHSGWMNEARESAPGRFRRMFFTRELIRLSDIGNQLERSTDSTRTERDMTLAMLRREILATRRELEGAQAEIRRVHRDGIDRTLAGSAIYSAGGLMTGAGTAPRLRLPDDVARQTALQLRVLKDRVTLKQQVMSAFRVEYYKKFSLAFASIVFVLVGAPLALRFPRGGMGAVVAVSLGIFSVYYVSLIGGETLAEKGFLSPFLAMWAANILFLLLGFFGAATMGSETTSNHRGSWEDVLRGLREAATHALNPRRRR